MKKVLITGITGLVGSSFAIETLKRDKDLQFLAITRRNKTETAEERVRAVIKDQCVFDGTPEIADDLLKRIDVLEGDIAEPLHIALSSKLQNINSIFHCAADVNLGSDAEGKTFNINFNGTKSLLEIAKELKVSSFHYVSTAYVAGKNKENLLVMEDASQATEWNNAYEHSKYESEKLVRASGIPYTIHRPSVIVGRRSDGRIRKPLAFYFVLEFMAVIKERQCAKQHLDPSEVLDLTIRIQATPTDTLYFVPIDYVVEVSTDLFFLPCENKTFHITGNSPCTTNAIEQAIQKTLKIKQIGITEEIKTPSMDEKLLHRFLGEFLPYFGGKSVFDVSNIKEYFGEKSLDWNFDDNTLTYMIGSYYKENFPELTDI